MAAEAPVWMNFVSKAKPKLKRTQIRYNRTTAKPPHNLLAKNKSTNQCLIGWRKGPWMLAEVTLKNFLFYYMQLTCVLGPMKKSHVLHDDSSGSKKNGFFSFLLVNIFSSSFLPDCKIRAISYHKLYFTKERKKKKKNLRGNKWSLSHPCMTQIQSLSLYLWICVYLCFSYKTSKRKWTKMVEILIWIQNYWRQADLMSCRFHLLRENLYELKNDVLFPPPEFQFWISFFPLSSLFHFSSVSFL